MADDTSIFVGAGDAEQYLLLKYGNRHGLIAGATGTGKTVTLQTLAEGFSDLGVPVFMADIKGDLSGLAQPGGGNPKVDARLDQLKIKETHAFRNYPIAFWDLFGEPALELNDFMRTNTDGRGVVSILAADKLMQNPKLYSTFLLWLLSELFEELPEVGDLDKPKLVFFFDEAHLLFNDASPTLV